MCSDLTKGKRAYNSLIIGPRGLGCETNQQEIMGWEWATYLIENHGLGIF